MGAPPEVIAALMAVGAATVVRAARTAASIRRARTALCHEPTNRGPAETAITKSSPCPLGTGAAATARVPHMKDSTTIATAATHVQLRMRIALPRSPEAPGGLLYASRQLRCNSCLRLPQKPPECPQVSALCHDDPSPGLRSAGSERPGGWTDRTRSRRPHLLGLWIADVRPSTGHVSTGRCLFIGGGLAVAAVAGRTWAVLEPRRRIVRLGLASQRRTGLARSGRTLLLGALPGDVPSTHEQGEPMRPVAQHVSFVTTKAKPRRRGAVLRHFEKRNREQRRHTKGFLSSSVTARRDARTRSGARYTGTTAATTTPVRDGERGASCAGGWALPQEPPRWGDGMLGVESGCGRRET